MANIKVIKLSFVNAYLLEEEKRFFLIDTGLSMHSDMLENELKAAGCLPGDLKLIIITHGDFDHTGNCVMLREKYGCKIAMHADDIPMVRDGVLLKRKLKGFTNRLLSVMRRLFRKKLTFTRFSPDILLKEGQDLKEYGLDARIIHIPGHTPGSVGILTAGGDFFISSLAVPVRYAVAPAPTGSRMTGTFIFAARSAALCIARIQSRLNVPMLMTRAPAMLTMSSTSSSAWAMTGEAPIASKALAELFMTT